MTKNGQNQGKSGEGTVVKVSTEILYSPMYVLFCWYLMLH